MQDLYHQSYEGTRIMAIYGQSRCDFGVEAVLDARLPPRKHCKLGYRGGLENNSSDLGKLLEANTLTGLLSRNLH